MSEAQAGHSVHSSWSRLVSTFASAATAHLPSDTSLVVTGLQRRGGADPDMDDSTWKCSFTYVCFTLALLYGILLIVVLAYLYRLVQENKRKAQKIFLCFIVAQCTCTHPCSPGRC